MCGIFGYINFNGKNLPTEKIVDMGDVISYRGPDGMGYYENEGTALGNTRLAILDVEHGQQPFQSEDGYITVVQNGEIFNHLEIAECLSDTEFYCRTHCDTEVILRLYQKEGISFISKLNGMFAIAIYDQRIKTTYLIRDRVGEKPLYFYSDNEKVIFGSEIKSILKYGIAPDVDYLAIDSYLTYNYVAPPRTMFKGIEHVKPGSYLEITNASVKERSWWKLSDVKQRSFTEDEWVSQFNDILDDAVKIRLRSDVPFGAFLSGGVDSSSVVGLMSKHMRVPVKTFSIGFNDKRFDESQFAEMAAHRFNTEHVGEKVESNLLSLWSKATYHCDQPHGDVSFMPTYRVAELASREVKMVLTGDGADELFAGYDKYKNFFDGLADSISDSDFKSNYLNSISLFTQNDKVNLYSQSFKDELDDYDPNCIAGKLIDEVSHYDRINQALYVDTMLLLSGNNLVKPDRMGMAVSIENRAPFLDYRMIELAFSMPGDLKLKEGETKYIYKKAVSELIGHELAYRKKQMFTVPIGDWLINELRETVLDLIFSNKSICNKLFNKEYLSKLYSDHCSGIQNNTRQIRALMALELWFREFIG